VNLWHGISAGKTPNELNVIVEIPKGSQNKYEVDKETGLVKLDRVLFSPFFYPAEYGMVPQTLGKDGDPLDALVLVTNPTYPGVLIETRVIGVLKMVDKGEVDDKILCVPLHDIRYANYKDIKDVDKAILNEIAHFFSVYKHLEGKKVEVLGWENLESAKKIIAESISDYNKKFKK
jgi:inorganic pyrophosphatase